MDGEKTLVVEHQGSEHSIPFDHLVCAVGRTARLMTRALPPSVETLVITSNNDGMATSSVVLNRADVERLERDLAAFQTPLPPPYDACEKVATTVSSLSLVRYQLELSELTQRLLTQEKNTTQRVAQALHDNLGQSLAVARLNLDAVVATAGDSVGVATTSIGRSVPLRSVKRAS